MKSIIVHRDIESINIYQDKSEVQSLISPARNYLSLSIRLSINPGASNKGQAVCKTKNHYKNQAVKSAKSIMKTV